MDLLQEAPLSARGVALLVVTGLLAPGLAAAGPITPTTAEDTARKNLGATLPTAKLLWVRSDKIYFSSVANFNEQVVTTGATSENNPRWSPDGSQILFTRISDGVYVMKSDFSAKTKLISGGHTASWTRDGKAITAVDASGYKVVRYDLATKKLTTSYDAQQSPYNGQKVSQAAELRSGGRFLLVFRLTPTHVTEIVDLQSKKYISNTEMQRGDCSPAWAPSGSYLITTARLSSRPVLKADFNASAATVSASKHFVGLDTSAKFYIHGQRVSNDGKYVTFGGKLFSGAGSNGDREIYIWKVGSTDKDAVRMTFETTEDMTPSLFIPPTASAPKLALSPSTLSFSATEGGSDPSSKSVAVSNGGGGTLTAIGTSTSYGAGSGWLKTTTGGSANSQSVKNALSIAGLSPNTYSATVKVSATGAQNSPQSYSVILTVKEKPKLDAGVTSDGGATVPKLGLSPSTLSFSAQVGGSAPAARTVKVSNTGGGTLGGVKAAVSYLGGSSGWLSVSTGGAQNAQSVTNTVSLSGLSANTYSATVQVSASGASNSPQTYAVTLTITDLPPLDAGPPADATPPSGDAVGAADGRLPTGEQGAGNPQDAVTLEGGCGCRLGSRLAGPTAALPLSLALLLGLLLLLRRRHAGCESLHDKLRQSRSGRSCRR